MIQTSKGAFGLLNGKTPCGCSQIHLVVSEDRDKGILSAERNDGRGCALLPIHGCGTLWHSSKRSCVMRRIVHAETGMPVRSPKEFTRRGVRSDDAGHSGKAINFPAAGGCTGRGFGQSLSSERWVRVW